MEPLPQSGLDGSGSSAGVDRWSSNAFARERTHLAWCGQGLNHRREYTFTFINTSPAEIESLLNNFKPKSSSGHDQLSMRLIKKIKSSLATPLAHIINQSLTTGIFPDELKKAKVIPIYKKDDEKILNN